MNLIDAVLDLAGTDALPDAARRMARLSLFDWMVCGLAGVGEPLAGILRGVVADEGGKPVASVIGGGMVPARAAAMVNGATSHALDYDDTHFAHVGHPSVAIYPAALAAGEMCGAKVSDVVDAFLIGAEASIRIGVVLGAAHYNRGFHQTATAGAFGATVAAGRIMGLTRAQMRAAIGLCSTRASGLKSQFGTMGKPLNAGIAAANGIECAVLARAGFTSADDGLEGAQGFIPTHSDAPQGMTPEGRFLFQDVKFKLHACCHGTHAMIEALAALRLTAAQVATIRLRTASRWLRVCDIKRPRTGLEVKFSYAWLAGMVLHGIPTPAEGAYTDALAADAGIARLAAGVTVTGDDRLTDMQAAGEVVLTDGRTLPFAHDLAAPLPEAQLAASLRAKATGMVGPRADALWAAAANPVAVSARDLGAMLRAG